MSLAASRLLCLAEIAFVPMVGFVVRNYCIAVFVRKRIFAVGIGAAVVCGAGRIRNRRSVQDKLVVRIAELALVRVAIGILVSVGARVKGVIAELAVCVGAGLAEGALCAGSGIAAGTFFLTIDVVASLRGAFAEVIFTVRGPLGRECVSAS